MDKKIKQKTCFFLYKIVRSQDSKWKKWTDDFLSKVFSLSQKNIKDVEDRYVKMIGRDTGDCFKFQLAHA